MTHPDIHIIPGPDATEVQWREGQGFIVIPDGDEPPYFPHGDGFRVIFAGDDTRVESDDGKVLWRTGAKVEPTEQELQRQHERDVEEVQAREDVRKALTRYQTLLDVAQSTEQDDNKRDHYLTSLVQVRSAKRVLWMDK